MSQSPDGIAVIWDWRKKRVVQSFQLGNDTRTPAAFTPDGEHYAVTSDDGLSIDLSRIVRGTPDIQFAGATHHVIGLTFDIGTNQLMSFDRSGALRSWDATTGIEESFRKTSSFVSEMAFSDTNKFMSLGDREGIKVVDLATLATKATFPERVQWWYTVKISPDGRSVAACSDTALMLCDVNAGTAIKLEQFKNATRGLEFINDDSLAVLSDFGRLDILNLRDMSVQND